MTQLHTITADGTLLHQGSSSELALSIFTEVAQRTHYTAISYTIQHVREMGDPATREERLRRVNEHLKSYSEYLEQQNKRIAEKINGHKRLRESGQ